MSSIHALYISHDGLLEPLGQSQVTPYLVGLTQYGIRFSIISFEHCNTSPTDIDEYKHFLRRSGIAWFPLLRNPDTHSLGTKLMDIVRGVFTAQRRALRDPPVVVHARSYVPAAIAETVSAIRPATRWIFDCRGMLADERKDAGQWSAEDLRYRAVKYYERRLFQRADAIVFLTKDLESHAKTSGWLGPGTRTRVIPCCVDTDKYAWSEVNRERMRSALGLEDKTVVVYSGSLGTWYLESEMVQWVSALESALMNVYFLVLTRSDHTSLDALLKKSNLRGKFSFLNVPPKDVANYLQAADIGLSLIKESSSKLGSSPTKIGEYLGCGLTVITNRINEDQQTLANQSGGAVRMTRTDAEGLRHSAHAVAAYLKSTPLAMRGQQAHAVAKRALGLDTVGVPCYRNLYDSLVASTR